MAHPRGHRRRKRARKTRTHEDSGGWGAIWEGFAFSPSVRLAARREPPEMMSGVCPRAPLHGSHGMYGNPDPAGCGSSSGAIHK